MTTKRIITLAFPDLKDEIFISYGVLTRRKLTKGYKQVYIKSDISPN